MLITRNVCYYIIIWLELLWIYRQTFVLLNFAEIAKMRKKGGQALDQNANI